MRFQLLYAIRNSHSVGLNFKRKLVVKILLDIFRLRVFEVSSNVTREYYCDIFIINFIKLYSRGINHQSILPSIFVYKI